MKIRPIIPKIGAQYGAVGAAMAIVSFLTFFYLDQQPWRNLITFLLDIVIVGFFCFLPIKEFKRDHNGGDLHFYHGMTIGFISYLMIGVIYSLFYAVFINFIEPDFIELYKSVQLEEMTGMKEMIMGQVEENPEAFYQEQLDSIKTITKSQLILDALLKKAIIGLFLTPVFSIILRTHRAR